MARHARQDAEMISQLDLGVAAFGDFGDSSFSPFITTHVHLMRFLQDEIVLQEAITAFEAKNDTGTAAKRSLLLSMTRMLLLSIANFLGASVCVRGDPHYIDQLSQYAQQAEKLYMVMKRTHGHEETLILPQIDRLLSQLSLSDLFLVATSVHTFILHRTQLSTETVYCFQKSIHEMLTIESRLTVFFMTLMTTIHFHLGYRMFRAVDEQYSLIPNMTMSAVLQTVSEQHLAYMMDGLSYLVSQTLWKRLRGLLRLQKDGLSTQFLSEVFLSYYLLSHWRRFFHSLRARYHDVRRDPYWAEEYLPVFSHDIEHHLIHIGLAQRIPSWLVTHCLCFFLFQGFEMSQEQVLLSLFPVMLRELVLRLQEPILASPSGFPGLDACMRLIQRYLNHENDYFLYYIDSDFWSVFAHIQKRWFEAVDLLWANNSRLYREHIDPALTLSMTRFEERVEMLLFDLPFVEALTVVLGSYDLCVRLYGRDHAHTNRLTSKIDELAVRLNAYRGPIRFADRVGVAQMRFMAESLSTLCPQAPLLFVLQEQSDQRKRIVAKMRTHQPWVVLLVMPDKKLFMHFRMLIRPVFQGDAGLVDHNIWERWQHLCQRYLRKKKHLLMGDYGDTPCVFLFMSLFSADNTIEMSSFLSLCSEPLFRQLIDPIRQNALIMSVFEDIATFQKDALTLLGYDVFRASLAFFHYLVSIRKSWQKEARRRYIERADRIVQLSRVLLSDLSVDHLYQKIILQEKECVRFHKIIQEFHLFSEFLDHFDIYMTDDPISVLRDYEVPSDYTFDMSALSEEKIFELQRVFRTLNLKNFLSIFDFSFQKLISSFKKSLSDCYQRIIYALSQRELETFLHQLYLLTQKLTMLLSSIEGVDFQHEGQYEQYMNDCFTAVQSVVSVQDVRLALLFIREPSVLMLRNYIELYAQLHQQKSAQEAHWMSSMAQLIWPVFDKILHVFLGIPYVSIRHMDTALEVLSQPQLLMLCRALSISLNEIEGFLVDYRDRPLKYKRHLQC